MLEFELKNVVDFISFCVCSSFGMKICLGIFLVFGLRFFSVGLVLVIVGLEESRKVMSFFICILFLLGVLFEVRRYFWLYNIVKLCIMIKV